MVCISSWYTTTIVEGFAREKVVSIASTLLVFLGIVTAILIAVFTTAHSQGRRNQIAGFDMFLRSLGEFKHSMSRVADLQKKATLESGLVVLERWVSLGNILEYKWNRITPSWGGYELNPEMEHDMNSYMQLSTKFALRVTDLPLGTRIAHELSLRGILHGLLTIDESTVERDLAVRLFKIFWSVSILLILCIAVRTIGELEYGGTHATWSWINFFIYISLPGVAIANLGALVYAIVEWRSSISKRDKAWAS